MKIDLPIPSEPISTKKRFKEELEKGYNLAAVFGVVKLNSVLVFGEFGGKIQHKLLKLKFLDEKIMNEIEKDLRICRRLMKLGIEK